MLIKALKEVQNMVKVLPKDASDGRKYACDAVFTKVFAQPTTFRVSR